MPPNIGDHERGDVGIVLWRRLFVMMSESLVPPHGRLDAQRRKVAEVRYQITQLLSSWYQVIGSTAALTSVSAAPSMLLRLIVA